MILVPLAFPVMGLYNLLLGEACYVNKGLFSNLECPAVEGLIDILDYTSKS